MVRYKSLAWENSVRLNVNSENIVILMCTPMDIDELCIGYLFSRGIIRKKTDLISLQICYGSKNVYIKTAVPIRKKEIKSEIIFSGCGSGRIPVQNLSDLSQVKSDLKVKTGELSEYAKMMFLTAKLHNFTGGIHCSSLIDLSMGKTLNYDHVIIREDAGRHNAVDKVIGRGFIDDISFEDVCLLTSGRIAADMVLKAMFAGIPVIASSGIPTTAAYEIALKANITMIGRINSNHPCIYTYSSRIVDA